MPSLDLAILQGARITEASTQANYTLILLHGLGASADDFAGLPRQLRLDRQAEVQFIFPQAPTRAVSANANYLMPAWYDILAFEPERKLNLQHIEQICQQLDQLLSALAEQGIASSKVVLAGFSQGGAIAYHYALTRPTTLAGLLAMSSYIPDDSQVPQRAPDYPCLIQHGSLDPVVSPQLAQQALQQLQGIGWNAQLESYPMEHSVCPSQIKALGAWLNQRFSSS